MTDESDRHESERAEEQLADREMVLELNFVPSWARKSSAEVRYVLPREETRERRRERREPDRRPRAKGAPRGRAPDHKPRGQARAPAHPVRPDRHPVPVETSPFRVRFLPERRALSQIVRKLRNSRRFYPLLDIAALFLEQPDSCFVRLEPDGSEKSRFLYQCRVCGIAALDGDTIMAHLLDSHFEEAFDVEKSECDPPAGNFVCVARCGLSGELLGPPNHNAYQEKLREMHLARFSDMSFQDYEKHVETVHDPASIEQWKEESRTQIRYTPKENRSSESLTALQAKMFYSERIAPGLIARLRTVSLPSNVGRRTQDPLLMQMLTEGWRRENRFPGSIVFALRGAFRHQGLHLFKTAKGIIFVGSVQPAPLDTKHVVENLQEVLVYLREHPGCTRRELVQGLRQGAAENSAEARNVLSPLSWLIEKGHIIEFFDGTLAVPMGPAGSAAGRVAGKEKGRS